MGLSERVETGDGMGLVQEERAFGAAAVGGAGAAPGKGAAGGKIEGTGNLAAERCYGAAAGGIGGETAVD